jgi:hypothetical protein
MALLHGPSVISIVVHGGTDILVEMTTSDVEVTEGYSHI